jgi:hypothetical protein
LNAATFGAAVIRSTGSGAEAFHHIECHIRGGGDPQHGVAVLWQEKDQLTLNFFPQTSILTEKIQCPEEILSLVDPMVEGSGSQKLLSK